MPFIAALYVRKYKNPRRAECLTGIFYNCPKLENGEGGIRSQVFLLTQKARYPSSRFLPFGEKPAQTKITLRFSNPAKHKAVYVWLPYHNF